MKGSRDDPPDFRPFGSIGVRFEWHASDGRLTMRAEGTGEWQGFSQEKMPPDYPGEPIKGYGGRVPSFSGSQAKPAVVAAVKAYNASPMVTPSKGLVRWWKASCAELKRATKQDTKRNRTRNDPSYADRAR